MKLTSKRYNHRSRNGTEFKSDDLEKGVTFTRLDGVSDERFAADCMEYGAMHALLVYPALCTKSIHSTLQSYSQRKGTT